MNRKQQNLIAGPIEGYKICNEDMTCRGVRFEVGKRVKLLNDDPLEHCKNGFHFCKYQSGVWNYYDGVGYLKLEPTVYLSKTSSQGRVTSWCVKRLNYMKRF